MTKNLTNYQQGVEDAMRLFDEEMAVTGDVRNARQAMKTLLRFGPQKPKLSARDKQDLEMFGAEFDDEPAF